MTRLTGCDKCLAWPCVSCLRACDSGLWPYAKVLKTKQPTNNLDKIRALFVTIPYTRVYR